MIKRIDVKDYEFVIRLNEENLEALVSMDKRELGFLVDKAELFEVVYINEAPAGFFIALREGIKDYDYKSYKWFCENYPKFLYIDRIVIDKKLRGQGIGSRLYRQVFEHAYTTGVELVAAAILTDNEDSLKFHTSMGFHEACEQCIRGGTKRISQQVKNISKADC